MSLLLYIQTGLDQNLFIILVVVPSLVIGLLLLYCWFRWGIAFFLSLLISYHLKPDRIQVELFHILPICRITFSNITDISEVKWNFDIFFRGMLVNRPFAKSFVSIRLKKGLFFSHLYSGIILTPKDPTAFVAQVKSFTKNNNKNR